MIGKFILEVGVESAGAAAAAERGGADRIELCADLHVGGLTPSREIMREARSAVRLPIHAMIRPRAGNFVYSDEEFAQMKASMVLARDLKMDGIVLGILQGNKTVDVSRTRELIDLASPMQATFHRAFDQCSDLSIVLEAVVKTGAKRILTSGGARNALEGAGKLHLLVKSAKNRIVIMPGGGINPENVGRLLTVTGATELHSGLGSVFPYGTEDDSGFEAGVRRMKEASPA